MSDSAKALSREFTRELWAINAHGCEFRFFVRPDADLDSTFTAWDADELEFCRVKGWLFSFEEAQKNEDR